MGNEIESESNEEQRPSDDIIKVGVGAFGIVALLVWGATDFFWMLVFAAVSGVLILKSRFMLWVFLFISPTIVGAFVGLVAANLVKNGTEALTTMETIKMGIIVIVSIVGANHIFRSDLRRCYPRLSG